MINYKSNGKIPWAFSGGNQGDANLWVSLQKYVVPAALYYSGRNCLHHCGGGGGGGGGGGFAMGANVHSVGDAENLFFPPFASGNFNTLSLAQHVLHTPKE